MLASLSLRARLLASFLALLVLLAIVVVSGIRELGALNAQASFVAGPVVQGVLRASEAQV
jgi:hypothetical protein